MKIALIQQHAGDDRIENLQRGLESAREAASKGAQLIVFAELAFTRFFPQIEKENLKEEPHCEGVPGPTTDEFSKLAREYNAVIVLNLFEKKGDRRYDSSPVINGDGSLLGVTRMVHIIQSPCFYEQDYYSPGDRGAPVYETTAGKIGVAICYDRHFPEYMRALALNGAEIVVIPQAGSIGEWPEGLYEAEVRVASMQNGYFCALANRVGAEERLTFAGESFVTNSQGQVIARAPAGQDSILYADLDLREIEESPARKHFLPDRRPDLYPL